MKVKWYKYFRKFPITYGLAVILDLGVKAGGLKQLLEFDYNYLGIDYDVESYVQRCKHTCFRS